MTKIRRPRHVVTKILVADEYPVVRLGIRQILADVTDFVVTGEAASGKEVLEKAEAGDWNLLVLDLSMPDIHGLEVLKVLKKRGARLPVLVLGTRPGDEFALRAFKAGAAGYLTKDSLPDEIVTALRTVAAGRKYMSTWMAESLASSLEPEKMELPHKRLSDREFEVLRLIAMGHTVKDIAGALDLSAKTVSTYRARILKKMEMNSNAALTAYVLRNGLAD